MTPTEKDAMALADRPKGHGLMCVIFATDLYAAMAKDGYTLPTNGSFGPATSEFIRAHITDYMKATRAEAELAAAKVDAERGREISVAFLPVMEAMRPLVLNLERLKDAARGGE